MSEKQQLKEMIEEGASIVEALEAASIKNLQKEGEIALALEIQQALRIIEQVYNRLGL